MECNFCRKTFSSKSNLTNHQKTAKYCLELQRNTKQQYMRCEFCDYSTERKSNLERHMMNCKKFKNSEFKEILELKNKILEITNEKNFFEKQIIELKSQIIEKDNTIRDLTEKAINKSGYNTTNNIENNIKINMIPYESLTDKSIKDAFINEFDENMFLEDQKGVAKFVGQCLLSTTDEKGHKKKLMVCTDPSRKIFKTINSNGDVFRDVEAKQITERIYEPVKTRSDIITKEINDKYFYFVESELEEDDSENVQVRLYSTKLNKAIDSKSEIYKLLKDNSEFSKELAKILAS